MPSFLMSLSTGFKRASILLHKKQAVIQPYFEDVTDTDPYQQLLADGVNQQDRVIPSTKPRGLECHRLQFKTAFMMRKAFEEQESTMAENERLRTKLAESNGACTRYEGIVAENTRLENELADMKSQKDAALVTAAQKDAIIGEMQALRKENVQELKRLQKDLVDEEETNEQLGTELTSFERKNASFEQENGELRHELLCKTRRDNLAMPDCDRLLKAAFETFDEREQCVLNDAKDFGPEALIATMCQLRDHKQQVYRDLDRAKEVVVDYKMTIDGYEKACVLASDHIEELLSQINQLQTDNLELERTIEESQGIAQGVFDNLVEVQVSKAHFEHRYNEMATLAERQGEHIGVLERTINKLRCEMSVCGAHPALENYHGISDLSPVARPAINPPPGFAFGTRLPATPP